MTVKQDVPDVTLSPGQTMQLDLRDYYQLGEDEPGGKFAGHPTIEPFIEDTSVAKIAYNYLQDRHGETFAVAAASAGTTQVKLEISWNGGGDTGDTAYQDRSFTVRVDND